MTVDHAAYLASFDLEGVKDQRVINLMVASKLKDDREHYLRFRDRIGGTEVRAVLDRHHGLIAPILGGL